MDRKFQTSFQNIFCINLKRRPDRLAEIKEELKKHNILVEFVEGVDGKTLNLPDMISSDGEAIHKGDIGCAQSHLKVARIAKQRGMTNYFVFEDDAQLVDNFQNAFPIYFDQLPTDWDFFYLGGNNSGTLEMVRTHIYKTSKTFTTHAYAVNGSQTIDAVIDVLSKDNEKVDVAIASLHSKFNSYVCRPHIAFQRASFSDILEKHTDYKHLRE